LSAKRQIMIPLIHEDDPLIILVPVSYYYVFMHLNWEWREGLIKGGPGVAIQGIVFYSIFSLSNWANVPDHVIAFT